MVVMSDYYVFIKYNLIYKHTDAQNELWKMLFFLNSRILFHKNEKKKSSKEYAYQIWQKSEQWLPNHTWWQT